MNNLELKLDDYSIEYFIDILSAFVNGAKPQAKHKINWDEILHLAQMHSLTGLLGYMSQMESSDFKPDEKTIKQFYNIYLYNLQIAINRNMEIKHIANELNRNKIPHILMKGYIVQNYYPINEMRSMGDIDIVVHEEDFEKADEILANNEFDFKSKVGFVRSYSKGNINIEIHTRLFSFVYPNKNLTDYFDTCWNFTVSADNSYSFVLNKEYHLLYLLSHIAKHFYVDGCGIRMILDIALYLKYFNGNLDFDYLFCELDKLNLTKFAKVIFGLCNILFNISIPDSVFPLDTKTCDVLTLFIIKRGLFGSSDTNIFSKMLRKDYEKNTGKNKFFIRTSSLFKYIFPPANMLKCYYAKAENGVLFYIIAWIIKAYVLIVKRKDFTKKIFIDLKNAPLEADSMYRILREIGL